MMCDVEAPGKYFFTGLAMLALAGVAYIFGWSVWMWFLIVISAFPFLFSIPNQDLGKCRECGTQNRVHPWSL
jgi:hypothetical protein